MSDVTTRMPTTGRHRWYALIRDGRFLSASADRQDIIQDGRAQAARYPHSVIRAVEFDAAPHEDPAQAAQRVGAMETSYPAFWEHWAEPREADATQPRSSNAGWITAVAIAVIVALALAWFLLKKDSSPSSPTPTPSQSTSTSTESPTSTSSSSVTTSTVTSTQTPTTVTKTETASPTETSNTTTEQTTPSASSTDASSQ